MHPHRPVATVYINMATTAVNTNAWTQVSASLPASASGVEVINTGGKILQLAIGAAGSEVSQPYTIPPGGTDGVIFLALPHGARLSAQAVDANSTTGYLVINLVG